MRKTLLEYDDVLRQQREIMYEQRDYVLEHDEVHDIVKDMFDQVILRTIKAYTDEGRKGQLVDYTGLESALSKLGFKDLDVDDEQLKELSSDDLESSIMDSAWHSYEKKIEPYREQIYPIEKMMVLRIIDRAWVDHIDAMSKLREGIHLRSYAQNNPLQAYISEGYEMFQQMLERISNEITLFCLNMRIQVERKDN